MKTTLLAFALLLCSFALVSLGCKKKNAGPAEPGGQMPSEIAAPNPIITNDSVVYIVTNGTIAITALIPDADGVVIIPETIGGRPVTAIADDAGKNIREITFVVFPDSITNIGARALEGTGLIAAWLPKDVPAIGENAFPGSAVTYVPYTIWNIPDAYTQALSTAAALPLTVPVANTMSDYRGTEAFAYIPPTANGQAITTIATGFCDIRAFVDVQTTLKRIFAPAITNIDSNAFAQCRSLTNAYFPEARTIGVDAFWQCSSLLNAEFPEAQTIGQSAFWQCTSLLNAHFPEARMIHVGAFYQCSSLTNAHFPEAQTIGYGAFFQCTSLLNAHFPEAQTISNYAFSQCTSLTNAHFPEARMIHVGAFLQCSNLLNAHFPEAQTIGTNAFERCTSLTNAEFPKAINISNYAFRFCSNLATITFPIARYIGSNAFKHCHALTDISFPRVNATGLHAFEECMGLKNASFPNAAIASGGSFQGSRALTNVELGWLTLIDAAAFYACPSLTSLWMYSVTPPPIRAFSFDGTPNNKTLYVPRGAEGNYEIWKSQFGCATISPIY